MEVLGGAKLAGGTLVEFVESASKELLLISPYFKPWQRLLHAIKDAAQVRRVKVTVLVRAPEAKNCNAEALGELRRAGVNVVSLSRLHAKLYVTREQAIATSMNILESSAVNSWEVGVRATRKRDRREYSALVEEANQLLSRAQAEAARGAADQQREAQDAQQAERERLTDLLRGRPAKPAARTPAAKPRSSTPKVSRSKPAPRRAAPKKPARTSAASCVRCSSSIPRDPGRPLCLKCFKLWSRYSNPDYAEKVCHGCGKPAAVTMARPLCRPCFRLAG